MKFEPKMSGVRVYDFKIDTIFNKQIVTLNECQEKVHRQETMDFILDNFRFSICEDGEWRAIMDFDSIFKLSILENYPEYEKEMVNYFGGNWLKYNIRFNH